MAKKAHPSPGPHRHPCSWSSSVSFLLSSSTSSSFHSITACCSIPSTHLHNGHGSDVPWSSWPTSHLCCHLHKLNRLPSFRVRSRLYGRIDDVDEVPERLRQ